ncbi:MAG: bifunctional glutamate N-acetyltransferase/amino-acid acetyltransferase ArgJ [Planctomycetaceae bacterium]|nr:bifunctional glutamate N-acetyltransferase/amino-acid acetyltransferase ArgJ [Planctomycetaceae bacterium]
MSEFKLPLGFKASGTTCGIKASGKPDLALFVSERPAVAAGVYTQNRVVGAPVIVSRQRTPSADVRAVVVNSGNSNACTGQSGIDNARTMTTAVANELGCAPESVLVCSTGVIGVQLPMDVILAGIPKAASSTAADPASFHDAATAMMTTDTFAKQISLEQTLSSGSFRISGAAKGAAMIAPNMATMLCVLMTDVRLTQQQCQDVLKFAVDRSFNCISVDGHMSTSDTVLLLANGNSGSAPEGEHELTIVRDSVAAVCEKLAQDIIRDAEGAEHFITIDVKGFETRESAFRIAKEIADSALVKTAITGADPNWGRITSAAGYAGIDFDVSYLSLRINGTPVFEGGTPVRFDASDLSRQMKESRNVHLELTLSGGPASGDESVRFWTSDLTQEYVRLNSEYTT